MEGGMEGGREGGREGGEEGREGGREGREGGREILLRVREPRRGSYSACSLGAMEHVLITCHLPYRHDNLTIASIPGMDRDGTKTAFLVSPEEK